MVLLRALGSRGVKDEHDPAVDGDILGVVGAGGVLQAPEQVPWKSVASRWRPPSAPLQAR